MTSPDVPATPRGPAETRRRIMDAAQDLFADNGYDHVSMRAIAERAGVNLALINRYFGSKRELFHEVLNAYAIFPDLVGGDFATLPERLARYIVGRATGAHEPTPAIRALLQSSNSPEVKQILAERMRTILFEPMAARIRGPEAETVAAIVAAIVSGAQNVRQLLGPDTMAAAGNDVAVARLTAVFTACFAGIEPTDAA